MTDFLVFINFKTYSQATGEGAVGLAQICAEVSKEKEVQIIPIVQAVDLSQITKSVDIPVWVQHLDPFPPGQFTGWISLEAVIKAGAGGTLLNHSEHQLPFGTIRQTISRIKNCKNFNSMVCAKTLGQLERFIKLKPDFIAYEVSELIGARTSIVDVNPKAVRRAVQISDGIPLIIGAGIDKAEDLFKVKELGAKGVLISSAVVLAENPKEKLGELVSLLNT